MWRLFISGAKSEPTLKSLSAAAIIRPWWHVSLRLTRQQWKFFSLFLPETERIESRKTDEEILTLNFLMFHEVTKPYEEEKNARVEVVFQHPKHDGEAK